MWCSHGTHLFSLECEQISKIDQNHTLFHSAQSNVIAFVVSLSYNPLAMHTRKKMASQIWDKQMANVSLFFFCWD